MMIKFSPRILVFVALVFVTFAYNYSTAVRFLDADVLDGHDIVLQADVNGRLRCFMGGKGGYGRSFAHPNVCGLVHPPIRVLTKIVTLALGTDHRETRKALSLAVSPLASSLTNGLMFLIACELGLGIIGASLVGLLLAGSFSQVIFGSVPEFYALGGFSIALALYVATISQRLKPPLWVWIVVTTVAGSITITNLAPVAGIYFLTTIEKGRQREAWWSAVKSTTKICVSSVALIVLSAGLISIILGRPAVSSNIGANPVFAFKTHLETEPVRKFLSFPRAIGNSILPDDGSIQIVPQQPPPHWSEADVRWLENSRIKHIYVMPDDLEFFSRATLVFVLVLGGIIAPFVYRKENQFRVRLAMSALLILLFNGFLHGIWGEFYFLYSQHWLVASMISIMIFFSHIPNVYRITIGTALTVGVWMNSVAQLEYIFQTLG